MTSSESGHLYRLGAVLRLEAFPLNPWRTLPEHPPHMQKSGTSAQKSRREREGNALALRSGPNFMQRIHLYMLDQLCRKPATLCCNV